MTPPAFLTNPSPPVLTYDRRAAQIAQLGAIARPEPVEATPLDQCRQALASRDTEALKQAGLMLLRMATK